MDMFDQNSAQHNMRRFAFVPSCYCGTNRLRAISPLSKSLIRPRFSMALSHRSTHLAFYTCHHSKHPSDRSITLIDRNSQLFNQSATTTVLRSFPEAPL